MVPGNAALLVATMRYPSSVFAGCESVSGDSYFLNFQELLIDPFPRLPIIDQDLNGLKDQRD